MAATGLERHLDDPCGRGELPDAPHAGAAGGGACGDLVRLAVRLEGERVAQAGFEAHGCAAARAAGSAVVALAEGRPALQAARLTAADVDRELGGLTPGARHGATLAVDALHRALGSAAKEGALRASRRAGRVLVAMSGGVDSAVAAWLERERGAEVIAVTLELWADPATDGEQSCCSPQAVIGARALAHEMGFPHLTLDLRERFRGEVVDGFLEGYAAGRTPNPCVRCNGSVRFDAMLALAEALGAEALATGHYARLAHDDQGPLLRAAADPGKDQSYVLARLRPEELARLRFPLGDLHKPRVRALAREAGLPVADRRESQDLCFLAGLGGGAFMRRHGGRRLGDRPGDIVDRAGRVLGRHDGHHRFTVGQRRGLNVAAAEPLYVLEKDAARNRVVVGPRAELRVSAVTVAEPRLNRPADAVSSVRIRHLSAPIPCRATRVGGRLQLELERPAEGVAPGQAAVLLHGDRVVGHGTLA